MRIEVYMRLRIDRYLKSSIERNFCRKCGNEKELEIHHEEGELFEQLLRKAHQVSNMEKRTLRNDYSNRELELLYLVLVGLHKVEKLKVLCETCHKYEHWEGSSTMNLSEIKFKNKYGDRIAKAKKDGILFDGVESFKLKYNNFYLKKILNQYLNRDISGNEIIKMTNAIKKDIFHNSRSFGIRKIRRLINENNVEYTISSRRVCIKRVKFVAWNISPKKDIPND